MRRPSWAGGDKRRLMSPSTSLLWKSKP